MKGRIGFNKWVQRENGSQSDARKGRIKKEITIFNSIIRLQRQL